MGWTKREIISDAYAELALAGFDFDLTADEMQFGLRRLDTLLATWSNLGIRIGYAFGPSADGSTLDQDSGLPLNAMEAVIPALAIRIAGSKGKAVPATTARSAKFAYDALLANLAKESVRPVQLAQSFAGAGNKYRTYTKAPDLSILKMADNGDVLIP